MSQNYAPRMGRDKTGESVQDSNFQVPALVARMSENATTSSVVTLNDGTSALEIAAQGAPAAMRWVTAADTQASVVAVAGATANYDHIIPIGTFRRFIIPQATQGVQSIVGVGVQAGLYRRVAYKSLGVGSVLTSEY